MKEEVLFLSLVTYTTILTLMAIFLLLGCKPNQDYGKMVKDYIRELKLDKNIFGIIYSIVLFVLTLPITVLLLVIHGIKKVVSGFKKK